jgi:tetratricopeptide (TPR) repeat protein
MNRHERRAAGKKQRTAPGAGARSPAALCELGHRHLKAGRTLDAQLCCRQALAMDSGFAEALHLMGLLSLHTEQADHAIEWFNRAVQHEEKPAYLLSLGNALRQQGRLEEAFRPLDRAVETDIESPEAWKALAGLLADLNRHNEATLSFQHVLKLDPRDGDAAYQAGLLLFQSGKPEEALPLLDRSHQLQPSHAPTLKTRALAMIGLGRSEEAVAGLTLAHALAPDDADVCNDMGVILRRLGRLEEALTWFDKALGLRADVKTLLAKAYALERLHRFDEALAIYATVKATDVANAEAELNTGLLHLLAGNFEAGWAGREARWKVRTGVSVARYDFAQPMWRANQPIAGKTILIYQDEGLGDVIQFARYVPMVAALGARIVLVVDDALVPLLSNLPGVVECVPRTVRRNVSFDAHCAITSLALAFDTRLETIPSTVPYLPAPEESRRQAWERRLGPRDRMRVGLVWSGNPRHGDDHNRSIRLGALSPLLELDATFVSLQKDLRAEDAAALSGHARIVDLAAHLTDFAETAALASCLDLVISVDTSMAHLAGALACPTWIPLPYAPDWRWMLGRDDSPWYPTVRLFRQDDARDYQSVIARMRAELGIRILERSARMPVTGGQRIDPVFAGDTATPQMKTPMPLRVEQIDQAIEWFGRAVEQDENPAHPLSLGNALRRQGRLEEAFKLLDRAVEIDIESAEAWKALAGLLADLNRHDEAALSFQHVLKLDPRDADAAYQAGFLLLLSGKAEQALGLLDRSDQLKPGHAPTVQMRALALQTLGRVEEAHAEIARAHVLDPRDAEICNTLGVLLRKLGRQEEALGWFDKALKLRPDFAAAQGNKAYTLGRLHRFGEALAIYAAAKAANPDNTEMDWNAALLQLLTGDFEAGWAGREARWNVPGLPIAKYSFPQPMWLGKEPIAGKTILIHQDEGLGDTIQFVRYVPMVAALGARVILLVADSLVPLLSKIPGIAECIARSSDRHLAFDTYCGIGSLPLAFKTRVETIPARAPYLPAPDDSRVRAWRQRLGPHDKLRVGLAWSGNPKHGDDQNRSLALRALSPLFDLDATFVSLQKEPRPEDQATLRERPGIVDLTAHLTDFADTAALVSCLDLVITVDTSMAHLAGAMACPTWILLPCSPDYRWLLDRDDSPWYPTARLFRQDASRDYRSVIDRVRTELGARIAAWSRPEGASPAALVEAGLAQMRSGGFAVAEHCCRQALALDPGHADTLHLMGLLSLEQSQFDQAVEWLSRAIRRDPKPLYLTSLGTTLLKQGRREEAVQVFDKAVQLKPDEAELWRNLGNALVEASRPSDAIVSFQQAVKLDPRNFDAAHKTALLLYQAERYEEALAYFNLSEELQRDHFPTIYMRALTLQNLKRFEAALADNRRAMALDPANADACHNAGNVLRALFRHEEAVACYDRSLALRPNFAPTLGNKAVALAELRRFEEAIATYRQTLAADPGHAVSEWNLGLLQLLLGDFEAGWAGQEARWKVSSLSSGYPRFSQPKWLGREPIAGKTILACSNEGLGDGIQFVRYVPMLAARGARVIMVVQDALCPLLSGMDGVAECLPRSTKVLPDTDFQVPFSSLPLAFGTRLDTIPAQKSYLPAPAAARVLAWERRLGAHDKLRVGLVWSGNPMHNNDRNRSIPLRLLAPVLDLDVTFVSLQKDPRPDDRAALAERAEIVDLTAGFADFSDTAALIACLDLVICVDTSVAHLAAALGCATWILLPYTPDYRWMLDREDSPWYPTARLFRQDETHDYRRVIGRVRSELAARIAAWPAAQKSR